MSLAVRPIYRQNGVSLSIKGWDLSLISYLCLLIDFALYSRYKVLQLIIWTFIVFKLVSKTSITVFLLMYDALPRRPTPWSIDSPVGATHEVTINNASHAKRVQFSRA